MTEMKTPFLIVGILICTLRISAQTIPNPTQTDVITIDNGTPGSADPNDRIRYTVTIQNTGGAPATLVQLNAVLDGRTTLVPGSFKSSPLAINDAYTATGNVGISVVAGSGLKANDFDDNIPALTIVAGTFATTGGGSITIAADGGFSYNPAAGFTGADTYVYTLTDSDPVGVPVPLTDMGTVTITVSNMIWFVDNTGGGSGGTGTLANPFKTLGDFNASSGPLAGQLIFIKNTGTNYNGGIVLKDNQIVFGTGHTGGANLANVLPFGLAPNSVALPAINGTPPIITNTASGDGVTLASGNSLRGFNVGACADFGMDNTTTLTVGNLVISEVAINNTTGGGFDASNGSGASMNVVFSSLSSTGGTNGIDLTSCAGTFTVNGGTITNPTGTGVMILNGSVIFSSSGVITDNSGFAVDVDNHDSNNVTFSGNITSTGTGIRVQNCGGGTKTFSGASKSLNTGTNSGVTLSSNAGATITISGGGLVITTTSGTGFNATGGATAVNVTGTGNTINSPTGTALNVNATTIGVSNLNFQSISSASSAAPTGIILDNTGSTGSLIVSGTGSAGSGGTISNKTGSDGATTTGCGIYLNSTKNVSLTRMQLNDFQNFAIRGTNVNGFTLANCVINGSNGNNDSADEGSISLAELTGSASFTSDNISGGWEDNVRFLNTTGTLDRATFTSVTFGANSSGFGNTAMNIQLNGTGILNLTVQNSFFTASRSTQFQYLLNGAAAPTGDLVFTGNTMSNSETQISGAGAIFVTSGGGGNPTLTYNISNNTIRDASGNAVNVTKGSGTGNYSGTLNMNTIGVSGIPGSGSAQGSGLTIFHIGGGTHTTHITNNTIKGVAGNDGIYFQIGDNSSGGIGSLQATVTGNSVKQLSGFALHGFDLNCGTTAGDNYFLCLNLSSNDFAGAGIVANGGFDVDLRQRFLTTVRLPGYMGANNSNSAVNAFVVANNTTNGTAAVTISNSVSSGGGGYVNGAACL